jgi:hypothetical protein
MGSDGVVRPDAPARKIRPVKAKHASARGTSGPSRYFNFSPELIHLLMMM